MYDLNKAYEDANNMGNKGDREFLDGVKAKRIKLGAAQSEMNIRILPSFGVANINNDNGVITVTNELGWDYFKQPTGSTDAPFTCWARMLFSWNFLGHGMGAGANRVTIIAPQSFDSGAGQVYDPVEEVRNAARRDPQWKYLTEDVMSGDTKVDSAAIPFMKKELIFNMIDLADLEKGTQLGLLGKSGFESLMGSKGLCHQRNSNCTPEILESNPMAMWNSGDITNPATGPVLKVQKEVGKGKYASYFIQACFAPGQASLMTYPVAEQFLKERYVLEDPYSFISKLSDQDVVDKLCKALDGVNPLTREHEHVFIKRVLGDRFTVPEPPAAYSAAAAAPGVGFGQPAIPGLATPQQQGVPPVGFTMPGTGPAAGPAGIPGLNPAAVPPPGGPVGNGPASNGPMTTPAASVGNGPGSSVGNGPAAGVTPPPAASATAAAQEEKTAASATAETTSTSSPSNVPGGAEVPANDAAFMDMLNGEEPKK